MKKAIFAALAVAALIVVLLYVQGTIGGHRVAPGTVGGIARVASPGTRTARAAESPVEDPDEWPGTVRSRSEAQVAARVVARVIEVRAAAGQAVTAGAVLAVLDDRDVRSRAEQARAGLAAALALARQASSDLARTRMLFGKEAATPQDLDAAQARAGALEAQVEQARHAVGEAEARLDDATIRAPFAGVVTERRVEPGDLTLPGRPLFLIADPASLRLEASAPESSARSVTVGAAVRVRIDALDRDLVARIDEVAAASDAQSRSVLVKAALPGAGGLRPGMFGRMLVPGAPRAALLIPRDAVARVGQLETVTVREPAGTLRERSIRTGKTFGTSVEVLSGLSAGEAVALP